MGTEEAVSTDPGGQRCDWQRCPGYPDDGDLLQREDGEYHSECLDAASAEEERYWRAQYGGRDPERLDAVLDRVFGAGDERRDRVESTAAEPEGSR